jgi:hypothetical protein
MIEHVAAAEGERALDLEIRGHPENRASTAARAAGSRKRARLWISRSICARSS